jgi:hypothetical protein
MEMSTHPPSTSPARDAFKPHFPPELVHPSPGPAQLRADDEETRDVLAGALLGTVACVGVWVAAVMAAFRGTGRSVLPIAAEGAAVGVFVGVVLGGGLGKLAATRAQTRRRHAGPATWDRTALRADEISAGERRDSNRDARSADAQHHERGRRVGRRRGNRGKVVKR